MEGGRWYSKIWYSFEKQLWRKVVAWVITMSVFCWSKYKLWKKQNRWASKADEQGSGPPLGKAWPRDTCQMQTVAPGKALSHLEIWLLFRLPLSLVSIMMCLDVRSVFLVCFLAFWLMHVSVVCFMSLAWIESSMERQHGYLSMLWKDLWPLSIQIFLNVPPHSQKLILLQ